MAREKILIVTTVPETLSTILIGQPRYLSKHFNLALATSAGACIKSISNTEGITPIKVSMSRGINPAKDLLSIARMIFAILKEKPDLVHSYTPKAGLVAMLAAFVCRVPVRIHTFTGLIFPTQSGLKQKLLIWIDRLICACATRIVPEGEGVKKDLLRFSITQKPLQVIGHGNIAGVDTSHFYRNARGLSNEAKKIQKLLPGESFTFCFVGRLNRDKGVSELEEAFSRLPQNAHLLLVGGLDETAPIAEETLASLKNNPRVHLLGFQQDIRPALFCSQVLVLPSYREGFPNVVLQAGSMQLPVIATDIHGCNEVIDPEHNGWLVKPKDVDSLFLAMKKSINTPEEELKKMGNRARSRIKERFEQRNHWKLMGEFYNDALGAR